MDVEGLSSCPSQENNAILKEILSVIKEINGVDINGSMEKFNTVICAIKELQDHCEIVNILKELIISYQKASLPIYTLNNVIDGILDIIKISAGNKNLYGTSWKLLLKIICEKEKENNKESYCILTSKIKIITNYLLNELNEIGRNGNINQPAFMFLSKVLHSLTKLNSFKISIKEVNKELSELMLILINDKRENTDEYLITIKTIQSFQFIIDDLNELSFPLQFILLEIISINQYQYLELTLQLLSQTSKMTYSFYSSLLQKIYKLLLSLLPNISQLLHLLNCYLNGNTLTNLFCTRILYLIICITPVQYRLHIISKLTNNITFLLTLLLNDQSNDLILSSIYIQHLNNLPGNSNLLRFLRTSRQTQLLISNIIQWKDEELLNILTSNTLEIITKETLINIHQSLCSNPSFLSSAIQSIIFEYLPERNQTILISTVEKSIEGMPLINYLEKDDVIQIIQKCSSKGIEGMIRIILFFQFAQFQEASIVKEVGTSISKPFVQFIKSNPLIVHSIHPQIVITLISNESIIKDLEQAIKNSRNKILRNGNGTELWNMFINKITKMTL
ncbi:hypothetical protein EDI_115940 [Entamoeba dispar SAW760]|uniref:Uncharacterized protein n=1 Tax=Entamoeba dispar (strain ATCC PRA-260 / SAW760) TaxID=370354 RepID=B0EG57_ENTDS|nr:uncharacterized protein EDI_115940 [Entamoeba dispar SAW760]EDR26484.1 hypothetical protein EDI_115940 [Entamoeba dispar SAW760]|eukprot:EDR26484.1 hypothetical protein EDI_115940 [Entamoeba dispar SAW760]